MPTPPSGPPVNPFPPPPKIPCVDSDLSDLLEHIVEADGDPPAPKTRRAKINNLAGPTVEDV
jgi:hypothetical protein